MIKVGPSGAVYRYKLLLRKEDGMENSKLLLEKALLLKPQDRFLLLEGLIRSLDEPNKEIEAIWNEEAAKRLRAHREGKTQGIPLENVFGQEV